MLLKQGSVGLHKSVRFVVIGDSKGKDHGINERVLRKIMHQICSLNPQPQYLVTLGDSVAGSSNLESLKDQLFRFRNLIYSYIPGIKIIPVVGNHEVNNQPVDDSAEKVFGEVYSDFEPDGELLDSNKTVYFTDIKDTRLIILNSFHYGQLNKITGEQLAWFERSADVPKAHKIVFVHSPAFPTGAHLEHCLDRYPAERDAFWKIVDEKSIDIVFSGHEHNYSRRIIYDNFDKDNNKFGGKVYQIISGGAGEKLRNSFRSRSGVIVPPKDAYHFVIVDIADDNIHTEAFSIDGKKIDHFILSKN